MEVSGKMQTPRTQTSQPLELPAKNTKSNLLGTLNGFSFQKNREHVAIV